MKPFNYLPLLFFVCLACNKESSEFTGLNFYLTADTLVTTLLNTDEVQPVNEPFIRYDEIVSYDTANHIFWLNKPVSEFFSYGTGYDGKGFVAMLNTTKIYCGVFWSPIHSAINPNIIITMPLIENANENCLQIQDGYPGDSFYTGHDDINDSRIIAVLIRDHKLR